MGLSRASLNSFAKDGAEARLREMETERIAIFKAFPELRQHVRRRRGRPAKKATNGSGAPVVDLRAAEPATPKPAPVKKRRTMSAAARRRISLAAKKMWAARRKARKASRQPVGQLEA